MPTDLASIVSNLGVASEALGIGDYTEIDKSPVPGKGSYNDSCLKNTSSKVTKEVAGTNASIQVDLENRREDIIQLYSLSISYPADFDCSLGL